MAAQSTPRVRRTAQNTQYTYALNRRIYDVKTYPVLSPQGAVILIYGHENGFTLVWRGGKRLKPPKKDLPPEQPARDKPNGGGAKDDAVMIIDSDDDQPPPPAAALAKPFVDKPEFEDADPPADSSWLDTVQTLDLSLGTAVRNIAVLPMPHGLAEDGAWGGVEMLKEQMVFVVTCLTADVFLVTVPLTPPSHQSKARPELRSDLRAAAAGRGLFGETLVALGGQAQYSDSVAITLARHAAAEGRGKSAGRAGSQTARVIVAAHSRQATGVLRLWDVSIGPKRSASERPLEPFQTEYLPNPLTSISFNPLHTTQLLTVASPHAVRIYDYSVPSVPQDESDGPLPSQGSWLLSLYLPFIRAPGLSTARKPVAAAAWISHGRAVLALLADGQWGIWDIDGAGPSVSGPSSSSSGLFGKATAGVRGAALTTFSASGHLEGTSPLRNPGAQKSAGDLVPMTPHTRREALSASFGGGPERLAAIRGGVHVVQLPGRSSAGYGEESAVLWLSGADHVVAVIPSVGRFWDAQARRSGGGGGNIFDRGGGAYLATRMVRLTDLHAGLLGERCCGAAAIPKQLYKRRPDQEDHLNGHSAHDNSEGLPVEILIQGESRLVVVHDAYDGVPGHSFLNSKLLASRKRILGPAEEVAPPAAIVARPRPGASAPPQSTAALAQSMSLREIGSVRGSTRGKKSLFGKRPPIPSFGDGNGDEGMARPASLFDADEPTLTQSMMATRPRDTGFGFVDQLEDAANAEDDEEAANERNVEEEILDIMEIDRALEDMEDGARAGGGFGGFGAGGGQHVFFETS